MFDFDELEDAEEPSRPNRDDKAEGEKVEKEPAETVTKAFAPQAPEAVAAVAPRETTEAPEAEAVAPETKEPEKFSEPPVAAEPEPDKELPNAKYSAGMILECVGAVLMRQQEDLDSPQVARLPAGCVVKVLEVGRGPSGKRVKLHATSGEEGWASVIASNTAPMFRSTARPFSEPAPAAAAKTEPAPAPAAASEMPWSSIRPGDTCVCKTSVVMRREEDMNSDMMRRLPAGEELEILKSGTEPTGRRFMAKDSQGNKGWISALSKEGAILLEVTQRGNQSLFVGAGQALGGEAETEKTAAAAAPSDRRAAALAAAEKRQAQFMSRGVGEKAAKNLQNAEQREAAQKQAEAAQKQAESRPKEVPVESRTDFKPKPRESQANGREDAKLAPAPPARQGAERQKEEAAWSQGLTSNEVQEVFELEALGFDFYQALHAFAAHRNKEVAANILLESQEEPLVEQPAVNVQLRPLPAAFPGPALNESQLGFSPHDLQKVQRLMNLGFDRPTAVKALYHCNRDEELAGNQLLS